jgi:hypothetical protein
VKAKYFAAIASIVGAIVYIAPAQAFLTFDSPLRVGIIDWGRDKPESQASATLLVPYLSGSVLRIKGKDVNVPKPCKPKSCRHAELQDPIKQLISVSGYRYEVGPDQMVEGGFGPLKVVNGGKEPTGYKIFDFGIDHPAEFKVILIKVNDFEAVFEAYVRACLRKPFSKKWWTCTPYFIPTGIKETVSLEQDPPRIIPIDVKTSIDKNPIKLSNPLKDKQQAILAASGLLQSTMGSSSGSGGATQSSSGGGTQNGTPVKGVNNSMIVAGPPGNKQKKIVQAALSLYGTSSAAGPDGGKNACAWMVNKVLVKAIGHAIGQNTNYVPSVEEDLLNGAGVQIPLSQAQPGDIIIAKGQAHIGICMSYGCTNVLSNSSSQASFSWQSDPNFQGYYDQYGGSVHVYRVK